MGNTEVKKTIPVFKLIVLVFLRVLNLKRLLAVSVSAFIGLNDNRNYEKPGEKMKGAFIVYLLNKQDTYS